MNLASALFKRILEETDLDTWANLRRHYLPKEYQIIYDIIEKHLETYHRLPSLEDLKLSARDTPTQEKLVAIDNVEADTEPFLLLDYLKNEFAQKETLFELQKFVEHSISFETAEETVQSLYNIVGKIEDRVELNITEDSMQKISLFESEQELASYIKLGLNSEFDDKVRFKNIDYILFGGKRGAGKSIVCANLAHNTRELDKSVLYFTIEMNGRETLQRLCSIATDIPHSKIKYRNLDNKEWLRVVEWWANRFENSEKYIDFYKTCNDFDKFHTYLTKEKLQDTQIDIIYDPVLTLTKIRAEAIKKSKKLNNLGLIVVDYINQVKSGTTDDIYDWKEQIRVSKGMKALAQELEVPVISPYQIDASGEARFSKGILDSADAAFILKPGPESITFDCTKMRGDAEQGFTSLARWDTLTIGPQNGTPVVDEGKKKKKEPEIEYSSSGIYDA